MPHWRKYFDSEFVGSWDLPPGRDVVLEIASVQADKVKGVRGEQKKPSVTFTKGTKKLLLNSTNARTIAAMYGVYTEKWIGKSIALYATSTEAFGETVECIRVRPTVPSKQRTRGNAPMGGTSTTPPEELNNDGEVGDGQD